MPARIIGPAAASAQHRPALLAMPEQDGAVRCVACAHRCLIRPGRQGICHVRENVDGRLVTHVYARAVAANPDPIEKKPLFHFYPGSVAFSVAAQGCNMHCLHCQNFAISQAPRAGVSLPTFELSPHQILAAAHRHRARSVAYTYTEPTVFLEWVLDSARLVHEAGLANVLVTNGYETTETLDLLAPVIDAANVDLKSFDDAFYRRICGARLAPVLDTLVGMRARGIWIEVTTLLIPGLNDDPGRIAALARWIASELGPETPWHVSRFFPNYQLENLPPTPVATIECAVEIGRDEGLRHVYSGNVGGIDDDTICAGCGATLIRRRGYSAAPGPALAGGRCGRCGHVLAGIGLTEFGAPDPVGAARNPARFHATEDGPR
jgi:pyruvate formate lyase activating enzyme